MIYPILELTSANDNYVVIQYWNETRREHEYFFDLTNSAWVSAITSDATAALSVQKAASSWVPVSGIEVSGTCAISGYDYSRLRLLYYNNSGNPITTEWITVDGSGRVLDQDSMLWNNYYIMRDFVSAYLEESFNMVTSALTGYAVCGVAKESSLAGDEATITGAITGYLNENISGLYNVDGTSICGYATSALTAFDPATSSDLETTRNEITGYINDNIPEILSAYGSGGVADMNTVEQVSAAFTTDITGAIIDGLSASLIAHGDIFWSKIVGVPLDEWEILLE